MDNLEVLVSNRLALSVPEPENTRLHIKRVATELFARRGYNGTSIRDIVEAAGVTKPALYYYFINKEHLFQTIVEEAYGCFLNVLQDSVEQKGDFIERLRNAIHIYLYYSSLDENVIRLIYGYLFGPKESSPSVSISECERRHIQLLTSLFREGMERDAIRTQPLEGVVCHFLGSVNIYIMARLAGTDPLPDHLEDTILDLLLNGIQ